MTKKPFTTKKVVTKECLELHIIVCGPLNIQSLGMYGSFITFANDECRYDYAYICIRNIID